MTTGRINQVALLFTKPHPHKTPDANASIRIAFASKKPSVGTSVVPSSVNTFIGKVESRTPFPLWAPYPRALASQGQPMFANHNMGAKLDGTGRFVVQPAPSIQCKPKEGRWDYRVPSTKVSNTGNRDDPRHKMHRFSFEEV
jgi:hypothetical protein